MITIVDYGLGNIQAFVDIYKRLNITATVARTSQELHGAQKIILPGVGSFDWAMERLNASGMRDTLDELVMEKNRPVFGVCVGMQMMARQSAEGILPGLAWFPGEVKRFESRGNGLKRPLPHMGWNDAKPSNSDLLFKGISYPRFYFLHSYYMVPDSQETSLAMTDYGGPFTSAIQFNNVFGTQFHPEKSHSWGIDLLKNFAET